MTASLTDDTQWAGLDRVHRALVVIDVVESVRLFELDEPGTLRLWKRLVGDIQNHILPPLGGRVAKSLGDGLLLEFHEAGCAVQAALQIRQHAMSLHPGLEPSRRVHLRIGIHAADVVQDDIDIYGAGVNLAARLAGLSRSDEIVASAAVRAHLVDSLDADIEDLGDCWLKNLGTPVRAFRLAPAAPPAEWNVPQSSGGVIDAACIAVLPFEARDSAHAQDAFGHVLADDVIVQLCRLPQLRVISRLSTAAFHRRGAGLDTVASALNANYVLHGSYGRLGDRVRLSVMLTDVAVGSVIWSDGFEADEKSLIFGNQPQMDRLAQQVAATIVGAELKQAFTQPMPTLSSYTILLGAVSLLHSLSPNQFNRSHDMLTYLVERHPTLAMPRAWLGLWHVMRVGQGWSPDRAADAKRGHDQVRHALDMDPQHSLSLAVDGLIHAYVHRDMPTAGNRYEASLRANPNESLAWLYKSAWHAYQEQGEEAVACALHAQSLSPLDPLRYYYDNFTSTALLASGNLQGSIDYGQRSLHANRMHGPTLRILAVAHSLAGEMAAAQAAIQRMLALEPDFTVGAFLMRYPGTGTAQVERYADALSAAGLPL